ncbi:GNAT family N-acetyltransferase [Vulcanisaeta thermophila]|uniref:GNAT family N-acetyltransferase n=1 Tax=Vulcanisaeta thermophila TaxID=867917 RepID=UPI000853CF78|nr:GNAT family N-acetyltransferase [Vulcanisaeta thermophila]
MRIRRALPDDVPQIVEFTRSTFPWGDYIPNVISQWINEGTTYVIEDGGRVLGILNAVPLPTGVLWLEGIRIRPEYRRRGLGRTLTEYAMEQGRRIGMRYAMLMVAQWNEPSHNLVRTLGFKPVLTLWAGVAKPTNPRKAEPREYPELIQQALRITNGYLCIGWRCTRATPEYALSTVREIYVGPGIALDQFTAGPPTTNKEQEILSTQPGQYTREHGTYILYEKELT